MTIFNQIFLQLNQISLCACHHPKKFVGFDFYYQSKFDWLNATTTLKPSDIFTSIIITTFRFVPSLPNLEHRRSSHHPDRVHPTFSIWWFFISPPSRSLNHGPHLIQFLGSLFISYQCILHDLSGHWRTYGIVISLAVGILEETKQKRERFRSLHI